jgi:hypothetical protein
MDLIYLVLVLRGGIEDSVRLARQKLGPDVTVVKAMPSEAGSETIMHVEAPIRHDALTWMHEQDSKLIWVNASQP